MNKAAFWGTLPDGRNVRTYLLANSQGGCVRISELGAAFVSWLTPDRTGRCAEILLGNDTPAEYLAAGAYMGALVGRWANRIAGARFALDGIDYRLTPNEGQNLLHGGAGGFHARLWMAEYEGQSLVMRLESRDGEEGFPGNVQVEVRYTLSEDHALTIEYTAHTDRATPLNLTSHPYFNLSGRHDGDIRNHRLTIDSGEYFEIDEELIPQRRAFVEGSPFDFREGATIGSRLDVSNRQLELAYGFDHCYVLDRAGNEQADWTRKPRTVAKVVEPESGRVLSVETDQPGLQFYSGNRLEGVRGRDGSTYRRNSGLCLEAGGFPNQINMPDRESMIVTREKPYRQVTVYRAGVME
ncbi:aldose epimerase family protein [Burkholderia sp. Ax-1724]|uniref:aldose epimerase family protein n=1 Tax=Burkholderia sp. Ax-1724 TaxID=2608336 RepID=UPI001421F9AE|nr:aldose epimerase family protein [Burkholderia sp. Ax-1724]NIF55830.1 galactose mutarotase [Burkholderia sp. Ax-1724]